MYLQLKDTFSDKPWLRGHMFIMSSPRSGAVITDKCHSLEVIDGNGILFWPPVLHALIIPMAA